MLRSFTSLIAPACLGVLFSLGLNYFSRLHSQSWPYSLAWLLVICLALNLIYWFKACTKDFTGILIGSIAFKLLLAFFTIFIYSLLNREDFAGFSAHFISHYILFTVFEIRYLINIIKLKPQPHDNTQP